MSFYPCFWAVLLLTSSVCVALDGVELLKKWAIYVVLHHGFGACFGKGGG